MLPVLKDYTPKEIIKALLRKLAMPKYIGHQFQCPVCKANLRCYKPIYKAFRGTLLKHGFIYPIDSFETLNLAAYSCPSCGASDRERLSALYLYQRFKHIEKNIKYTFIDFAPSPGLSVNLRRLSFLQYRTADLYRTAVDDRVDLTDMKIYTDQSVDFFLCSHILACIPDDRKAMFELRRILKRGGFGIVMVPLIIGKEDTSEDPAITSPADRWKYYCHDDNLRFYGRNDLVRRLEQAGFTINQLGIKHFGKASFAVAGIHENSVLYVVE